MARFDVYPNPSGDGYLLNVQSDLLSDLNTRLVVPLMSRSSAPKPAKRLNPTFEFNSETFVMMTQFMAAVPTGILKNSAGNLESEFEKIAAAIDMIMQGF